jgi:hypothetical protein
MKSQILDKIEKLENSSNEIIKKGLRQYSDVYIDMIEEKPLFP